MQNAPSLTARVAALPRAAHQLLEGGAIFADPLAIPICGEDAGAISRFVRDHPDRLRLFIEARSRFAGECHAHAVDRGVCQVVVLGAGCFWAAQSICGAEPMKIEARVTSQTHQVISTRAEFRRPGGEVVAEAAAQQFLQAKR